MYLDEQSQANMSAKNLSCVVPQKRVLIEPKSNRKFNTKGQSQRVKRLKFNKLFLSCIVK
jgi:hypothetical protein